MVFHSKIIARVFPRRTEATPTDALAFVGDPPLWRVECDEVHVSVTFTWDVAEGQRLLGAWSAQGYNVRLGGPAINFPAEEFVPGRYLKTGWTITSRGCPNRCHECLVPVREGGLRTLAIRDGWNVADNNLLACPTEHLYAVFAMLDRQREPKVFSGGLEARLFTPAIARRMAAMTIAKVFFAYDRAASFNPLADAASVMRDSGWDFYKKRCDKTAAHHHRINKAFAYVLCGHEGDTRGVDDGGISNPGQQRLFGLRVTWYISPYQSQDAHYKIPESS